MVIKKTWSEKLFDVANVIFMIFMICVTLYPMWYVLTCSFSDGSRLIGDKGAMLLPKGFNLEAYKAVLKNPNILSGYKVTLFVLVAGTCVNLFMTSLGAYVLSRKDFAIRKVMMMFIVFTMYFGGGLIPTYLLVYKWLDLGNTLWALILPGAISTYNLIIMRTNFESIPPALIESAKIDGAGEIRIFSRIILPLSLPIIAVMVLFYGVNHWNAWFGAAIYIRDVDKRPLQLVLRSILIMNDTTSMAAGAAGASDQYTIGESIKYAIIVVATVPILVVYPFIQKYFVTGIMIGAVKG